MTPTASDEEIKPIVDYLRTLPCRHDAARTAADCGACAVMNMHTATKDAIVELTQRIEQTARARMVAVQVALELIDAWPDVCQFCRTDEKLATHIEPYKARDGSPKERISCDEHAERYLTAPVKSHEIGCAPVLRRASEFRTEILAEIRAMQAAAAAMQQQGGGR